MFFGLNDENKLGNNLLREHSYPFSFAPRNKKGQIKFASFSNSLGSTTTANISTPIGHVKILVKSQFWKMLKCKENRSNVLMNIKDTLKAPLVIAEDGDSIFFFKSFRKKSGRLFTMFSVCGRNDKGELVLKTSYERKKLRKVEQFMSGEIGNLLYAKDGGHKGVQKKKEVKIKR